MNLVLQREAPPLRQDETGAIRIGNTRILLEIVIRAFQDGVTPETIPQRYEILTLADIYATISYCLRHEQEVESYLSDRDRLADSIRQNLSTLQPNLSSIRSRLLARKQSQD